MIVQACANTLELLLDAAPWLLLGLLAAGLIKAWVPENTIKRWLGTGTLAPILRAALLGAPLPLCSCGVLPAAIGLKRAGASQGSTVAFMISTPETGVDSIAISYALLGPFMAASRPIAAIFSAVFTGLLAAAVTRRSGEQTDTPPGTCAGSCCGNSCATVSLPVSAGEKTRQGLRHAFTDILDDIAGWLALGLLIAGLMTSFVPADALADLSGGLPVMLIMLIVGIPMYICATASTPLATAFLLAGMSPGTVLVFLLAGPATNIATLGVVRREFGLGILVAYLTGITASSLAFGLLTDFIGGHIGIDVPAQMAAGAELVSPWIAWVSAGLLVVLAIRPLRRRLPLLSPVS